MGSIILSNHIFRWRISAHYLLAVWSQVNYLISLYLVSSIEWDSSIALWITLAVYKENPKLQWFIYLLCKRITEGDYPGTSCLPESSGIQAISILHPYQVASLVLKVTPDTKAVARSLVILFTFYASRTGNQIGALFIRTKERTANV